MKTHEVEKHFENHPHDINTAAHNILSEWRKTQRTEAAVFANLRDALERVNMAALVEEIQ